MGNNFYTESNNSGKADLGYAGMDGRGYIIPNNLEMSNVDLAQEFTDMIVAQRGFQANSRVITVSDTMLQELIDLKRG
jgi:flagellar hook protein FlgE